MEFLFTNQIASFESLAILLCLIIVASFYARDGYRWLMRVIGVLTPRKQYLSESKEESPSEQALAISEEKAEIIEEYLAEKSDTEGTLEAIRNDEVIDIEPSTPIEDGLDQIDASSPYKELLEEISETPVQDIPLEVTREMQSIEPTLLEVPEEEKILESPESQEILAEVQNTIQIQAPDEEKMLESPTESTFLPPHTPELQIESPEEEKMLPPMIESILPENPEEEEERFDLRKAQEKIKEELTKNTPKANIPIFESSKAPSISPEKREKLTEIVNTVKTLLARGHIIEARGMIVNGLAIQKEHRELNLLLATIYERDHDYIKSEYIYKDLARIYPDNSEILMRLANALAMQHKYDVSYEIYKKVLSISGENEEILYTLAHLSSELGNTEETYEYSRAYIRQYPKNPEILWLYSQSQIALGQRKDAIETLIKLKNLTPYNAEILDLIQKLVTEEELAGNFGN